MWRMRMLPKNLLKFKSLSSLSNRRHHIFQPADAAKNNHGFLLRRLCWSSLDEDKVFSDISSKPFSSSSIDSQESRCFWGTATNCYTALSPNNFSPLKPPNFPHFNDYLVRGSSGGVVCLDSTLPGDVVFWNPTTNEVKFLPETDEERPLPEEIHPLRVLTVVNTAGFGFDSKSQDYKYVRWVTFFYEEEDDTEFWRYAGYSALSEMYSLKLDSWKIINCPYPQVMAGSAAASMNGLYWNLFRNPDFQLMRFDLATEEFTCFPFPHTPKLLGCAHLCKLFGFGGRLVLVIYPTTQIKKCGDSSSESSFELWAWNGGWWSKEFDDCIEGCHMPLGFSQDARLMFLVGRDCLLHVFDIRTKNLKKCDVHCNPHQCDLIPYVESTFPLHRT